MPLRINVPDLALPLVAKEEPKSPEISSSEEGSKSMIETGVGSGR